MQFYPTVEKINLSSKSSEEDILKCINYIRNCLVNKYQVSILIKKKDTILPSPKFQETEIE